MTHQTLSRQIAAGQLELTLTQGAQRLDELLTFASRLNPRRGYLFVSRVLGKHVPVEPQKMDGIHAELAAGLSLAGNDAYVVGMAETAVGLGAGVARHLGRLHASCIYQHTTRFLVPRPWVRIREAHSHADTMHMAQLCEEVSAQVDGTQDLVLVDDEISTGLTLAQLARELLSQPVLGKVTRLHIVSLVSWLTDEARARLLAELPAHVEVHFVQLMAGTFLFTPNPHYQAQLPEHVDTDFCAALMDEARQPAVLPIEQDGLFGKRMDGGEEPLPESLETRLAAQLTQQLSGKPEHASKASLAIYGMGEFLDAPFRMALSLARAGHDVRFQSSTRSPIAIGDGIESYLQTPALGVSSDQDRRHFLYNPDTSRVPLAFSGIGAPQCDAALEEAHVALARQRAADLAEMA